VKNPETQVEPAEDPPLHPSLYIARDSAVLLTMRIPHGEQQRFAHVSCFVIEVHSEWYLVTAAHVISRQRPQDEPGIEELLASLPPNSVHFELVGLNDPPNGVAFVYKNADKLVVPSLGKYFLSQSDLDDWQRETAEALGQIDVCLIHLNAYYREHLRKSHVKPITAANIFDPAKNAIEKADVQFFLCGAPLVKPGESMVAFKFLEVWPLSDEAPILDFEPKWESSLHEGDVRGMSGGAVFGIVNEQTFLAGVQSAQITKGSKLKRLHVADIYNVFRMLQESTAK